MAKTLFELVQDYLNRKNLPETFKYSTSSGGGNQPPVDDDDDDDVISTPGIPSMMPGRDDSALSAFSQLRKNYLNPYARIGDVVPGFAGKGLQALQDMLPVNPRAIYENELRNQGVITDDIGRIVADPTENYNTVENVMAGYNANKITQETIDERVGKIGDRLKEKYKLSDTQIQGLVDGTLSAEQLAEINAKAIMPGTNQTTNLIDQIQAVAEYGRKFVDEQSPVKMKSNIVETQLRLGKGEDVSTMPIAPPSLGFGNPNLDAEGNIKILDIVGSGKKDTIVSSKDDDSFGLPEQPFPSFSPGKGFIDQGGLGEFGTGVTPQSTINTLRDTIRANVDADRDRGVDVTKTSAAIKKQSSGLGSIGTGGGGGRSYSDKIKDIFNYQVQPTTKPSSRRGGQGADDGSSNERGSSKIVCTMMNETYGFGSFRNKIWIKYAKDNLKPEHQKGYHKIFLPLVKIAKTNKLVRKVLEHIAVHRTIDIRQESRNKVHLLGRIYRKILEPICYLVGKYGKD